MSVFQLRKFQFLSLYKTGLILIAIGLPLSRFLMSLGGVFLITSWLLKGSYKQSFLAFWQHKLAVSLVLIFAIHVLALVYSQNLAYGVKDLKIKLPLLIYPIVIAGMPFLSNKFWKIIFYCFTAACFLGTLHSTALYFGWLDIGRKISSYRDAFVFVSHIRFSLFIGLSTFILIYFWLREKENKNRLIFYLLPSIWFVLYIFLLGIPTGVMVLLMGFGIFIVYYLMLIDNPLIKIGLIVLLALIPLVSIVYVRHCIKEYYNVEEINWEEIDEKTVNGKFYFHDRINKKIENGNYVWMYVCEEELRNEWNKRSTFNYDSLDKAGQQLRGTLIRYLASKDLRKDSVGLSYLTSVDITNVENGIANINYLSRSGIRTKIDQTIFEFDTYYKGGNPSGNSITQKLEFWKTAVWIIKENFWFGVGTGDIQEAFDEAYNSTESPLKSKYRLRAHNQFLTMFIAFGFIGFITFTCCYVFPITQLENLKNLPYLMFFFVVTISFLTEDTLETQAGATFYAFFSCFFLLFRQSNQGSLFKK